MTTPTLPYAAATAAAQAGHAHAQMAGLYSATGDQRRATDEARLARRWLDLLAPSLDAFTVDLEAARAQAEADDLAERVHAEPPADLVDLLGFAIVDPVDGPAVDPPPPVAVPSWAADWPHEEPPAYLLADDQGERIVVAVCAITGQEPADIDGDAAAEEVLTLAVEHAAERLTPGAREVAAERHRQITEEGYNQDADLAYDAGTLGRAAGSYLLAASADHPESTPVPGSWPWTAETWKPSADRRRNLVKAAALLVAEVDAQIARDLTDPEHPDYAGPWLVACGDPLDVRVAGPFPTRDDADRHIRLLQRAHDDRTGSLTSVPWVEVD